MRYANILLRIRGLRQSGQDDSWRGYCPVTDHRRRNLAAKIGAHGQLLIRCFAGCSQREVLRVLGATMRDCFPDSEDRAGAKNWQDSPKPVPVEFYVYQDEQGNDLYRVVRTEPKGFYQERWEGGKWRIGLAQVRRVLFRLPEILASDPKRAVVIVEGERKVLALEKLGIVATCNPGGTGAGWKADYSRLLAGRRLVVLPDNDPVGLEHGETVVGSLVRHGAAAVRIVELPGLPPKGDVVDFLKQCDLTAELGRIIRGIPEWKPVYADV